MDSKLLGQWLRYNGFYRQLAKMPLQLSYKLAEIAGDYDFYRRNESHLLYEKGLSQAFPMSSEAERSQWCRRHCEMMSREILDIFKLPGMTFGNSEKRIEISGIDYLSAPAGRSSGTLLVMGHYGRPQMMAIGLGLHGQRIGMLTQPIDETNTHLSVVERKYLSFKTQQTLRISKGRWVRAGENIRSLYKALESGETMAFLFDLYEPNVQKRFRAAFFDGELCVAGGLVRIAEKTRARLLYGVVKDNASGVKIEIRPLPEDPHSAMQSAVKELEKDVLTAPWQWWQWNIWEHIWLPSGVA